MEAHYFTILWWFFTTHWHESAMGVHVPPILNPHPIPQGHPSAPALNTLSHASNLDWRSISHMIIYTFQWHSLKSSHPRLFRMSSTCYWRRKWQPIPVFLSGKSHGWRSLVGPSSWGSKESDMTEQLHYLLYHSVDCIELLFQDTRLALSPPRARIGSPRVLFLLFCSWHRPQPNPSGKLVTSNTQACP